MVLDEHGAVVITQHYVTRMIETFEVGIKPGRLPLIIAAIAEELSQFIYFFVGPPPISKGL